jgi:hypothetical protein
MPGRGRRYALALTVGISLLAAALVFSASPSSASPGRACGHRTVHTKIGPMKLYFRVRGPVRCGVAKRVVRSYFHQPTSACLGSGCFIHLSSGWNCRTASGDVTEHQGSVTTCARDHGRERIATSRFPDRGFELIGISAPPRSEPLIGMASAGSSRTYFPQGQSPSDPVFRPRVLAVAGEGSFVVQKMRWRSWEARTAHGRGIGAQDDCVPSCAEGTFHRAPAKVRLWRPRVRCGNRIWTRMTLTWLHGPPRGGPGESGRRRVVWSLGLLPCE